MFVVLAQQHFLCQIVTVLACHDAMASHRRASVKHLCCFWIFFIVVGSAHRTEDLATDFNVGETCNFAFCVPPAHQPLGTMGQLCQRLRGLDKTH